MHDSSLRFVFICLVGEFPTITLMTMSTRSMGTWLLLVPGRDGPHEINLVHFAANVRWFHMGSRCLGLQVSILYRMGTVTFQAAGKQARQGPRDTPPGEHLVGGLASGGAIEARNNDPGCRDDWGGKQGSECAEQLRSHDQGKD